MGCSSWEKIKSTNDSTIKSSTNTSAENFSIFPKTELSDSIAVDSVTNKQSIRAEQKTDKGTLLMISNGREEQGHLLVSSVLGQEGDRTFQNFVSKRELIQN